jgi:tetratricopeptide (TPR) repeat protein
VDPTDGRGYLGLARGHEKAGRVSAARAVYEDGTRATRGENAFLWQAWAVLEARQGDVATARRLFDAATVADKRHAAAWHGWGMLELRQGNFQRARDLLLSGLRLAPESAFLYQSLGVMAADRGRADEARAHFAAGARTAAGRLSPALWQAWARLEAKEGRPEQARVLFQRALAASPKNRHTWLAWASLEASLGLAERARELFRQGASLNRFDVALLQAWAVLEARLGNAQPARALFARAARLEPGHQPVWQAWGCAEESAGEPDAARALFQYGIFADPSTQDAAKCYQAWAVLEARVGKLQLARRLFRSALKLDRASVPTWQAWAQMEEAAGYTARAAELQAGKQDADDEVRRLRGQLEEGSDRLQAAMDSEAAWRRQAATYETQLEVVNETNRQLARERDAAQKGSEALAAQGMRDGTLIAEQAANIADLEGRVRAGDGRVEELQTLLDASSARVNELLAAECAAADSHAAAAARVAVLDDEVRSLREEAAAAAGRLGFLEADGAVWRARAEGEVRAHDGLPA